jgi:hypothetical protein
MSSLILHNNVSLINSSYSHLDGTIDINELIREFIINNANEITHENIVNLCKLYTKSSEHKIEYKTSKKRVSGLVSKNNGIIDVMNFDIIDKYIYFHIDLDVIKLTQFTIDNNRYYTKTIGNYILYMVFDKNNNILFEEINKNNYNINDNVYVIHCSDNKKKSTETYYDVLKYFLKNNINAVFKYFVECNDTIIFEMSTKKNIVHSMLKCKEDDRIKISVDFNKQLNCYFVNSREGRLFIPKTDVDMLIHCINGEYDKIKSYIYFNTILSKKSDEYIFKIVIDNEKILHLTYELYDHVMYNRNPFYFGYNDQYLTGEKLLKGNMNIIVDKLNENRVMIKNLFNLDVDTIDVHNIVKTLEINYSGDLIWNKQDIIKNDDGTEWLINNEYSNGIQNVTTKTRIFEYNNIHTNSEKIYVKLTENDTFYHYVKIDKYDLVEYYYKIMDDTKLIFRYEKKNGIVNLIRREYVKNKLASEELIINNKKIKDTNNILDIRLIGESNEYKSKSHDDKIMRIDLGNIVYKIKGVYLNKERYYSNKNKLFGLKSILIYEYGTGGSKMRNKVREAKMKKEDITDPDDDETMGLLSVNKHDIENNHQVKQTSVKNGEMKVAYNPSVKMVGGTIGYKAAVTSERDLVIVKLMIPIDAMTFWDDEYDKYRSNKAKVLSIIPISIVKTNDKDTLAITEHITDNACPVCLTKMPINMLINPCKHHICSECAEDYFIDKKYMNCPTCNKKFTDLQKYTFTTYEDEIEEKDKDKRKIEASILEAYSFVYNNDFKYTLGETITIDKFEDKYNKSCGPGIHYHSNINDAIQWFEYLFIPKEIDIVSEKDITGIIDEINSKEDEKEFVKSTSTPIVISKLME